RGGLYADHASQIRYRKEIHMSIEVRVPQLPESVADATLISWHKKTGEAVSRDENLVDLETDKVVLEVPAPAGGVLKEIRLANGRPGRGGRVLALLEGRGAGGAAPKPAAANAPTAAKKAPQSGGAPKLSPAAKRVVEENRVDAGAVPGSGRD